LREGETKNITKVYHVYGVGRVVSEEERGIGHTFHQLMKTRQIGYLDFQKDSGLETIEFWKSFFIEVVV
jgi:hypothetical protein